VKKLIVECEACGEVFTLPMKLKDKHIVEIEYSINLDAFIEYRMSKEIKHDCSSVKTKKIIGVCKVIGIEQSVKEDK